MKKHLLILIFIFGLLYQHASASEQKNNLNPTIENAPETPVCPNAEITLTTQEYDSYQWYKRTHYSTSQPVSGATSREFTMVSDPEHVYYVRVKVTLDGQEAMSSEVLIDQYWFRPKIGGFGENIDQDIWGNIHVCEGNFELTLFSVDSVHFNNHQWYRSGNPIDGALMTTFKVNDSGYYYFTVSPPQCPDMTVYSFGGFDVSVHNPAPPIITQEGDSLLANWNVGQWFLEEEPIPGATHWIYIPQADGYYSFEYVRNGCPARSEPYHYSTETNINEPLLQNVNIYPVPAFNLLNVNAGVEISSFEIFDAFGRKVMYGHMQNMSIDISIIAGGFYYIHLHSPEGSAVKKFIKAK